MFLKDRLLPLKIVGWIVICAALLTLNYKQELNTHEVLTPGETATLEASTAYCPDPALITSELIANASNYPGELVIERESKNKDSWELRVYSKDSSFRELSISYRTSKDEEEQKDAHELFKALLAGSKDSKPSSLYPSLNPVLKMDDGREGVVWGLVGMSGEGWMAMVLNPSMDGMLMVSFRRNQGSFISTPKTKDFFERHASGDIFWFSDVLKAIDSKFSSIARASCDIAVE